MTSPARRTDECSLPLEGLGVVSSERCQGRGATHKQGRIIRLCFSESWLGRGPSLRDF
jgi:hypothetical protein